jgi:hypothetical protein
MLVLIADIQSCADAAAVAEQLRQRTVENFTSLCRISRLLYASTWDTFHYEAHLKEVLSVTREHYEVDEVVDELERKVYGKFRATP